MNILMNIRLRSQSPLKWHTILEIFLLSQMRASDLVHDALVSLGAGSEEVELAKREAETAGLTTLGHSMSIYANLIGPPLSREEGRTDEPYKSVVERYHLSCWPDLELAVWGASDGMAAELEFVRPGDAGQLPIRSTRDVIPWKIVLGDILGAATDLEVVDEWYPMKDYRCQLPTAKKGESVRRYLQFDFGLLQKLS